MLKLKNLFITVLLLAPVDVFAAALVRSASGSSADVTVARDLFREDLGGGAVPGANGSFGTPSARREINWDGVPDESADPTDLPLNFFNSTSPRGAVFSTPGSSVRVSADAANPSTRLPLFADINPAYATAFAAFSAERIFAPLGSNIVDVTFFVPATPASAATVTGFGAVFTDVDLATSTTIEYFGPSGDSLGKFAVPAAAGNANFSFLGVSFTEGELIARVRITSGTTALASSATDSASVDVVAMDDFLYAEPVVSTIIGQPDLTVTLTRGTGRNRGRTTVTVRNTGTVASTVTFVDVYSSKNNTIGTGDTLEIRSQVPALDPDATHVIRVRNRDRLIATVDPANAVDESDETNNNGVLRRGGRR